MQQCGIYLSVGIDQTASCYHHTLVLEFLKSHQVCKLLLCEDIHSTCANLPNRIEPDLDHFRRSRLRHEGFHVMQDYRAQLLGRHLSMRGFHEASKDLSDVVLTGKY